MRVLHLTLRKEWFDKIASGKKKEEYRENKLYWKPYLVNKQYDEVHFRNGYSLDKPFMRVKCLGIKLDKNKDRFVIKLGEILEIKNYKIAEN